MRVVFVEDTRKDVDKAVTVLESTGLFAVEVRSDYGEIDDACLEMTDFFVLDVLIRGSDEDFTRFIRKLRKLKKPFMAFTTNSEHTRLTRMAGSPPPPLREVVLEHGGLCMIMKRRRHNESAERSQNDIQLDLVERVLSFYWAKR